MQESRSKNEQNGFGKWNGNKGEKFYIWTRIVKNVEYVEIEKYVGGPSIYVVTSWAEFHVVCTFRFDGSIPSSD